MKIGILLCGLSSPTMYEKYGYYDQQFRDLLAPFGFDFATFTVVNDEFPAIDDDCDGYLLTGSKHNLDEGLPWMAPMLEWIRATYGNKPLVGICFGHQAIAKALGGSVADAPVVYQTGVINYNKSDGSQMSVAAWHGQQIVDLPPVALEVTASAEHCPAAAIVYANKAISFQAHPEFNDDYIRDLYESYNDVLALEAKQFYQQKVGKFKVNHSINREIADFFQHHGTQY